MIVSSRDKDRIRVLEKADSADKVLKREGRLVRK